MNNQPERDSDRDQPTREETVGPKRPYRTPRLVTYGNLRELALAKGGAKGDGGGVPASKT